MSELLERYGVSLAQPAPAAELELLEADDGTLSFELIGSLPGARASAVATLEAREEFRLVSTGYERSRYEFELIDRERDFRRAFHLHSTAWFQREYLVVVHEHCERPIGNVRCHHYEGSPIRDAFAGVAMLVASWMADPPDCATLRCLE